MTEKIIAALKELKIENYRINESLTDTVELFFIKRALDLTRKNVSKLWEVTVFRDLETEGGRLRGFTSVHIHPGMEAGEIEQTLKEAWYAASFVKNPYFDFVEGGKEEHIVMAGGLAERSLEENAKAFADALYAPDTEADAFINSAEIFAKRHEVRIITSAGIDVSYTSCIVNGEFITQCITPEDVELYNDFSFDAFTPEELTDKAAQALRTVRDRARAKTSAPAGTYSVLLSGEHVGQIMSFYFARTNASLVYAKYSSYTVGCDVQGEDVTGERISLTAKAVEPYSFEGIPMRDRSVIKDSKVECLHGATRFCRYLSLEPTGYYDKFACGCGSVPLEEMKKEKHLYIVSFSDFQMDEFSGHFGGEIRLGYLYDGEKTTIVTGGSINGNIFECGKKLVFSKERYSDSSFEGPYAVMLRDVETAGE